MSTHPEGCADYEKKKSVSEMHMVIKADHRIEFTRSINLVGSLVLVEPDIKV